MKQAILPLRAVTAMALMAALAACDTSLSPDDEAPEPGVQSVTRNGPEGAPPGSCWGRTVSPAVVERVSEQVQVSPAEVSANGTITKLPVFRNEVREKIVTPRRDNWFETPCPEVFTPTFIESLQRALTARGYYAGQINGMMDRPTRAAIQLLQASQGRDSSVLSLETARQLGLIAVDLSALPSE